jgi:drug/metabolite transporter (DMT)-like permease
MSRWSLIGLSILLTSLGQLFFKKGMMLLKEAHPRASLAQLTVMAFLHPQVLLGFLSFGAGAVLWLAVLAREEVGYAYPLSALGYLVVLFASHFFFQESLSFSRILGVLLIMAGVFFIEWSR